MCNSNTVIQNCSFSPIQVVLAHRITAKSQRFTASPWPPQLCRKAASVHQINMTSVQVGEAAGPCGRCFATEECCCAPALTCGLECLRGIRPFPLPALRVASGVANLPEHHSALTVQAQHQPDRKITPVHLLPPLL